MNKSLRKLSRNSVQSSSKFNFLTRLDKLDRLLDIEVNTFNELFLDEDSLLKVDIEEEQKKFNKQKIILKLVSFQIEKIREFDMKVGRLMFCEWSGNNIDVDIEDRYVYEELIKKMSDFELILYSEIK